MGITRRESTIVIGCLLAYVYLPDGTLLNEEIIRQGYSDIICFQESGEGGQTKMLLKDWIMIFVQLGGLLLAAAIGAKVAAHNIKKTAKEERATFIHEQFYPCVIEAIDILGMSIELLEGVANRETYAKLSERAESETAYDRYWNEIHELAIRSKINRAATRLIFPSELIEKLEFIYEKVDKGRDYAEELRPDNQEIDNAPMLQLVKEADDAFNEFIQHTRDNYLSKIEKIPEDEKN